MLSWEDFEIELRRLHDQASNFGVEAVQSAGFVIRRAEDMQRLTPKAHKIFIRGCHYGFALAQARVGRLVLEIEGEGASIRVLFWSRTELRTRAICIQGASRPAQARLQSEFRSRSGR